jgi:UDP-3-O-[3-hydroxymyristoyl] N-acetylglucosamine deacetylase
VRVPPGTNAADYRLETPQLIHHSELDIERGADDGVSNDDRGQLYLQYLEAVDNKRFSGNFGDFIKDRYGDPTDSFWMDMMAQGAPEEAVARDGNEEGITASVDYAESYLGAATMLSNETYMVLSPEALLSALEACGVDNARIEIEGGGDVDGDEVINIGPLLEVPVVDGSALGWVLEVQKAGLRDALPSGNSTSGETARMANAPQEMITVTEGDSFISFYPGLTSKITAGIDFSSEAEIIGKQWFTWSPAETSSIDNFDKHFRWEVAPARTVLPSVSVAEDMYASGLLRAGPDDCCLVGNGDSWYDPALERFPQEEAARKAVADLVGNLALAAKSGWRGMPQGHVVAYKASIDLQLQFAKALFAKSGEWAYSPVEC